MNERIEKLIEQCTVQEFSDCTGGFETFDKAKFAELIVRECLEACRVACEIEHPTPPTQQQVVWSCMREIEETFRS